MHIKKKSSTLHFSYKQVQRCANIEKKVGSQFLDLCKKFHTLNSPLLTFHLINVPFLPKDEYIA